MLAKFSDPAKYGRRFAEPSNRVQLAPGKSQPQRKTPSIAAPVVWLCHFNNSQF
jgi:hypothetical protein